MGRPGDAGDRYYAAMRRWGPTETLLIADSRQGGFGQWTSDLMGIAYASAPDADFDARGVTPRSSWQRHPGGSNVCFLDGHVKAYHAEQLLSAVPTVAR